MEQSQFPCLRLGNEETMLEAKKNNFEAEGTRSRDRPKKNWREIVQNDCQAHKLNREDAMDHYRWMVKDD